MTDDAGGASGSAGSSGLGGDGGQADSSAGMGGGSGSGGSEGGSGGTDGKCENDPPTAASLAAARGLLDSGASSANLSPNGCVHYERVVAGGLVVSEKLTFAGQTALEYTRTASTTEGRGDFDLDGFIEWTYELTRGATPSEDEVVLADLSSSTQAIAEQKTLGWAGDNIHVVVERPDGEGALEVVQEFSTPRYQESGGGGTAQTRKLTTTGCSAEDAALIEQRLKEAMDGDPSDPHSGGLACLHRMKVNDKETRLTAIYAAHDIEITCVPDLELIAVYDGAGWFDTGTVGLRVNPTKFGELTPEAQRRTMFHEMLHEFGEHDPKVKKSPRVSEIDPTDACADLCWPSALTTKCACATCLHTNICDPRCAPFKDCNADLGARCPCSGDYYDTCTDCLANCFSGLGCSFYSYCDVLSVECTSTARTCPP